MAPKAVDLIRQEDPGKSRHEPVRSTARAKWAAPANDRAGPVGFIRQQQGGMGSSSAGARRGAAHANGRGSFDLDEGSAISLEAPKLAKKAGSLDADVCQSGID